MKSIVTMYTANTLPTKSDVAELASRLALPIQEGEINPLHALGVLTALSTAIETAKKAIAEEALQEAEKYPEKTFGFNGATFQVKEVGVKYDFTNDKEWNDLNDTMAEIKAEMKGRETMLKSLKLYAKTSTTSVVVTLNK